MIKYILPLLAFCLQLSADNLISNADFAEGFKGFVKTGGYSLRDNVLVVRGQPELGDAINGYQKLTRKLELNEPANAKLELSFDMNVIRISGRVNVAIRESDAAGETLRYHNLIFSKWDTTDGWRSFKKTVDISAQAVNLEFFLMSHYLDGKDQIEFRNLKILSQP